MIVDDVDRLDAIGQPADEGARRGGRVLVVREAHILRRDRLAILPPDAVAQAERGHESTGRNRRIACRDADLTVLDSGDVGREPCHVLAAGIDRDERFGDGGGKDPRVRVVGEDRGRLTHESEDDVLSRRRR